MSRGGGTLRRGRSGRVAAQPGAWTPASQPECVHGAPGEGLQVQAQGAPQRGLGSLRTRPWWPQSRTVNSYPEVPCSQQGPALCISIRDPGD